MIRIALPCLLILVAAGCTPHSNAPWFVSDVQRNVGGGATFDVVRDLGAGWQGDVLDRHYVYLTADGKPGAMTAEVNSCSPSDTSCSDDVQEEAANGLVTAN